MFFAMAPFVYLVASVTLVSFVTFVPFNFREPPLDLRYRASRGGFYATAICYSFARVLERRKPP